MVRVVPIRLSISTAYLILGSRPILVDTGKPGEEKKILRVLQREGVAAEDLSLILHTHAHVDHCGSTGELKKCVPAPTAIHAGDVPWMPVGYSKTQKPTSLVGWLLITLGSRFMRHEVPPPAPKVVLCEEISLAPYGVEGRVIPTPGHTSGSVSILLENGEAIVGDLLMGGFLGIVFPRRPAYPVVAEDLRQWRASVERVLSLHPTKIYVGHGGPLDPDRVAQWLSRCNERTWFCKFRDAFRGLAAGTRGQSSFRVHSAFSVAVIACGWALGVSLAEWLILLLCIAMVFTAEMFNSALESLAKAITRDEHPHVGDALDIGSAAVLVASMGAAVVGGIVFVRRLGMVLGWW